MVVIVIGPAERLDGRYGCPPIVGVGVNGVIGEEGAFMIPPPQRLQCVFPEGLWQSPNTEFRALPSRPKRRG